MDETGRVGQISLVVCYSTGVSGGFFYFGAAVRQHIISRYNWFLLAGDFFALTSHSADCAPDVVAAAVNTYPEASRA